MGYQLRSHGFKAQLCHSCIKDEMELYWQRQGTNPPLQLPSMRMVARWPMLNTSVQDLCICRATIVNYENHCHACRDDAWNDLTASEKAEPEDIFGTRIPGVAKGQKAITANQQWRNTAATRQRRHNNRIARLCPCGNLPKKQLGPQTIAAREYISYCLACMGVKVDPRWNKPPVKYREEAVANLRRRQRLVAAVNVGVVAPGYHRTKGPLREIRDPSFRVNIERGWVHNDPFVGGHF
ncbi:hypothetical protein BDW02DRAFT_574251 [Decorospora gaudefroyi]|uniref:Uncharacterized protein n=1 Tax=Decorospora gaudefroyi TaxID=184978 RepID=A0A6A5K6U9_9PLEO|nr:hypothetical protein BDW02DRAFT_574251 [Decorospora gaudefroyi]